MTVLTLRERALADRAGLAARHPEVFRVPLRRRALTVGVLVAMAAVLVLGLWRLGFSPERILRGLSELGRVATMMLPPDPGSWVQGGTYALALLETVAIAFLGTLLAALVALPLGFLAARNATLNRATRFLVRRASDTIRGVDQLIWALIWVTVVGLGPFAGVLPS
jgi:phosphonate transport system permease protein